VVFGNKQMLIQNIMAIGTLYKRSTRKFQVAGKGSTNG
jgi:hypothetical protein